MGQKVNPISFRLSINKNWDSMFIAEIVGQDRPLTLTTLLKEIDLSAVVGKFAGAFQAIASNTGT